MKILRNGKLANQKVPLQTKQYKKMDILLELTESIKLTISTLYKNSYSGEISFQKTRKEFEGEITLVVFPLLKTSGKNPEQTGHEIGQFLNFKFGSVT